jgi:hypothetical protein
MRTGERWGWIWKREQSQYYSMRLTIILKVTSTINVDSKFGRSLKERCAPFLQRNCVSMNTNIRVCVNVYVSISLMERIIFVCRILFRSPSSSSSLWMRSILKMNLEMREICLGEGFAFFFGNLTLVQWKITFIAYYDHGHFLCLMNTEKENNNNQTF